MYQFTTRNFSKWDKVKDKYKDHGVVGSALFELQKLKTKAKDAPNYIIHGKDSEGNVFSPLIRFSRKSAEAKVAKLKKKGYEVKMSRPLSDKTAKEIYSYELAKWNNVRSAYKSDWKFLKKNALATGVDAGYTGGKIALTGVLAGSKAALALTPVGAATVGGTLALKYGLNKFRNKPRWIIHGVDKNGEVIKPYIGVREKSVKNKLKDMKKLHGSGIKLEGPMKTQSADLLYFKEYRKFKNKKVY